LDLLHSSKLHCSLTSHSCPLSSDHHHVSLTCTSSRTAYPKPLL
jgi:hypothetical protein